MRTRYLYKKKDKEEVEKTAATTAAHLHFLRVKVEQFAQAVEPMLEAERNINGFGIEGAVDMEAIREACQKANEIANKISGWRNPHRHEDLADALHTADSNKVDAATVEKKVA